MVFVRFIVVEPCMHRFTCYLSVCNLSRVGCYIAFMHGPLQFQQGLVTILIRC